MKRVMIEEKLRELGVHHDTISLGDFDYLGEATAKRVREPGTENWRKYGAFYRANYERGILIYNIIRRYKLTSMLEIGFGRGYASLCAAKAFHDMGVQGTVTSIDPFVKEQSLTQLRSIFPDLMQYVKLFSYRSEEMLQHLSSESKQFDLTYIDGDHSYEATKNDWEGVRQITKGFVIFDDYHEKSKQDSGTIDCARAIDEIDWNACGYDEGELVIMDRRLFKDDRFVPDDAINYGQVISKNSSFVGELSVEW